MSRVLVMMTVISGIRTRHGKLPERIMLKYRKALASQYDEDITDAINAATGYAADIEIAKQHGVTK